MIVVSALVGTGTSAHIQGVAKKLSHVAPIALSRLARADRHLARDDLHSFLHRDCDIAPMDARLIASACYAHALREEERKTAHQKAH